MKFATSAFTRVAEAVRSFSLTLHSGVERFLLFLKYPSGIARLEEGYRNA